MKQIKFYKIFLTVGILLLTAGGISAQSQRNLINDGVERYKEGKYADAEVNFKKSIDKDFETFQGHFNLGDAYYKQKRYDEALKEYQNSLPLAKNDYQKSKVYHNIGNALLKSKKIKESIGAYQQSLKLDPNDPETKYNLSYALNMLKQQQKNQKNQQNKNDKDKDKDQKKNQQQNKQDQNKQNQNKQDQDKKDQQQQQNQQQQNEKDKQQQGQKQKPKKDQISKEEAERILNALKNNEAQLQKELRKKKGKPTKTEKDW